MEPKDFAINTKNPVVFAERHRKEKPKSADMELNMTAMIDVLFMLILFFLIGGRFVKAEGSLLSKMPELSDKVTGVTPPSLPVTIAVRDLGEEMVVTINLKQVDTRTRNGLYNALKEAQRQPGMGVGMKVYINPTRDTSWNSVMKIYNTVLRSGYTDVEWSAN